MQPCFSTLCLFCFAYFFTKCSRKNRVQLALSRPDIKVKDKLHTLQHRLGADRNRTQLLLRKRIIMLKVKEGDYAAD